MNKTKPILATLRTNQQKNFDKDFLKNDKIFEKTVKSQGWELKANCSQLNSSTVKKWFVK